jgi:high-affinity Fe2+/Pb2+ permease
MNWLNGEMIAGMAIAGLGIVFTFAGIVSDGWREILPADYILIAVGAGLMALGVRTMKSRAAVAHTESDREHRSSYY